MMLKSVALLTSSLYVSVSLSMSAELFHVSVGVLSVVFVLLTGVNSDGAVGGGVAIVTVFDVRFCPSWYVSCGVIATVHTSPDTVSCCTIWSYFPAPALYRTAICCALRLLLYICTWS